MALQEYAGHIVLEVDSVEIEVVSFSVQSSTGRKPVKTMNRSGLVPGFARGITEYNLSLSVVIPLSGDIDWAAIEGAKITVFPLGNEALRTTYRDCFTVSVGNKYQMDNEAMRDLTMVALSEGTE